MTETLDEQGHVVSTSKTDTKTTLLGVCSDSVTLEVEACMEVAGKRFRVEPQTIKEGFHGEAAGSDVQLEEPIDGEITIEGTKIPCKIRRLSLVGPNGKTESHSVLLDDGAAVRAETGVRCHRRRRQEHRQRDEQRT